MNSRDKGIIFGVFVGAIAGTLAYLSLSELEKEEMVEESSDKITDINDTISSISEGLLENFAKKLEESKETIDHFTQLASQTLEESLVKAKANSDHYSHLASQLIDDKLKTLNQKGDDSQE